MNKILIALIALAITACASLSKPSALSFEGMPIIEIGSGEQEGENYILHFPAHYKFPVTLNVTGSLMDSETSVVSMVSVKREVWAYREWISYDGITWQRDTALPRINMIAEIHIDSRGAVVDINTDLEE